MAKDELISKIELLKEIDDVMTQYSWEDCGSIMDTLINIRDMVLDQEVAYDVEETVQNVHKYFLHYVDDRIAEKEEYPACLIDDLLKHNKQVCRIIAKGKTI